MAAKTTPHGLTIVLTGDGKGKTTAALGLALRAAGHGLRTCVVQFVKTRRCGEHMAAERLASEVEVVPMGRGFVTESGPEPADRAAAAEALAEVRRRLADPAWTTVVADEILGAAGLGLVSRDDVEALVADRPEAGHLVLTGRGAWPELVEAADLVTEMRAVKHPYDAGIPAQPGIEY